MEKHPPKPDFIKSRDKVEDFFEKIRVLGFFEKIFSWSKILDLREKANKCYIEYKSKNTNEKEKLLEKENQKLNLKCDNLENENKRIEKLNSEISEKNENLKDKNNIFKIENTKLKENLENKDKRLNDFEIENKNLKFKHDEILNSKASLNKELIKFKENEEIKKEEYEKQILSLNQARDEFKEDKIRIQNEKEEEREKQFEEIKKTWRIHEENVKNELTNLCNKLNIEYVEKVPFKGSPDNTIKIADEYIIFDAKSPANENLENFPKYIKEQVDKLKKYVQEKNVKPELFLVIPNNTIDKIKDFYEETADYKVSIITINSLAPILLSLQKIQEYEFTEELSPEDRANISKVIGKFTHATKRKIQIDTWLNSHFIEIINNCETLPNEIVEEIKKSSQNQKLNAPTDRKHKELSDKDILNGNETIKRLANKEKINLKGLEKIEEVNLEER